MKRAGRLVWALFLLFICFDVWVYGPVTRALERVAIRLAPRTGARRQRRGEL